MRGLRTSSVLLAWSALLLTELALTTRATAQSSDEVGPEIRELVVSPAAEPVPALRYSLWRGPSERKPGNAASFYYRALLQLQSMPKEAQFGDQQQKWIEGPLGEFPIAEASAWVDQYRTALGELDTAVSREECDWDLQIEQLSGQEAIAFLLPEVQESRQLARLLQVKARLEVAEGRVDDALATLRDGYQLAADVANAPILINGLVGIAIAGMMDHQLLEVIEAARSPNLYWAIARLPQPLVDLRTGFAYELTLPRRLLPFLEDAETAQRSPDEWRRLIVESLQMLGGMMNVLTDDERFRDVPLESQLAAAALVIRNYPEAKRRLLARGFALDRVEQMPVGQVIAIESRYTCDYIAQEAFKWLLLPSWKYQLIDERLAASEEKLRREGYFAPFPANREILPLTSMLLPAYRPAKRAEMRSVRELAGIQAIEAIRMHAAANGGRLPKSLDEVRVVPVPDDPFTGKAFNYRLEGDQGRLDLSFPIPEMATQGRIYLISVE